MPTAAYRDHLTGRYPITIDEIRAGFNGLFGDEPPAEVLDAAGVDPVEAVAAPTFDPATQALAESAPERRNGKWRQTWTISARPTPAVPDQVSAVQAKTALFAAGLYDAVEAAIGGSIYALIRIWWASAQTWRRDNPYILAVQAEIGLTDDQVDDLFRAAAAVPT